MSEEKSAIEVIYLILDKINNMEKQLKVIDNNIKLLNNKIVKTSQSQAIAKPTAMAPPPPPDHKQSKSAIESQETVKIFGRIKNKRTEPIKGVEVKIFDSSGVMIKNRTTDNDGYWEARVSPGQYGIEYDPTKINNKLRPANFKITVNSGIKELDISQQ